MERSLNQRLSESSSNREKEYTELASLVETEPKCPIRWQDAIERMRRDNLGLRQSRKMLEDSEQLAKRQWLSLVPRTAAYLNISQGIASITDFDSDALNASLLTSFNIPNPFEFYAMLYGAALQTQNARWSSELDNRRAFSELYSAYMEAELLREEEAVSQRRWQSLLSMNPSDIAKNLNDINKQKSNMKRRLQAHRENVNRLLNTPGRNWELRGGLPELSYRNRYQKMKIGRGFGKLALNLYAIQVERAIMQTERVKFRQWPTISFGLSNPPLYSSSGNYGLSAEDFTMFSGVSKSVDFGDFMGRVSIRDAKYRLQITREQVRQNMEREASRMIQIRDAYGQLLMEEKNLQIAMKRLDRMTSTEIDAVTSDLELRSGFEMQLIQTSRQIKQLDLQYLIWDEYFWKS